jgi:hypothetical protein
VETAGKIAGTAMAFYAILNGLGRIMWGWADDQPADPGFAAEQPMGAFAIQNRCFAKKIP